MRPKSDLIRTVAPFKVISEFSPAGDQPQAIDELEKRLKKGEKDIVLFEDMCDFVAMTCFETTVCVCVEIPQPGLAQTHRRSLDTPGSMCTCTLWLLFLTWLTIVVSVATIYTEVKLSLISSPGLGLLVVIYPLPVDFWTCIECMDVWKLINKLICKFFLQYLYF